MALPSGYTRLAYIQSSGTQYIDTGFKPNNNTRVVMDVEVLSSTANPCALFGARTSATSNNYAFMWTNSVLRSDYNNVYTQTWDVTYTTRRVIDKNKETTTVDGTSQSYTNATFQAPVNLVLLALNNNGTKQWYTSAKLYSCQVYDNGTLVRDFIPVKNSAGTLGLYDQVNGKFYTNAGTGTFTGEEITPGSDHLTLVDGTVWGVVGGRCLVGGTGYEIKGGRTLVGGTAYDVEFSSPVTVTITGTGKGIVLGTQETEVLCSVSVNGVTYTSAKSGIVVQPGDTITFYVKTYNAGNGGWNPGWPGYVQIDGTKVYNLNSYKDESEHSGRYNWTVPSGITSVSVVLAMNEPVIGLHGSGYITVTTS